MTKTLIITEKPSVARDIARVLSVKGRGEGYLAGEKYIISWAVGHLLTLCEPDDYDPSLKRWSMHDLPILPQTIRTKPVKKTYPQLKILVGLMKNADVGSIVCATDSGREGELIFRYIYNYAKCQKPVTRLWISSMTDEAIQAGFANLRPMSDYDSLYHSAQCRSHSDWLVGINASRAYSITHNANLPVGRVQTPTPAMIVARQAEIDSFVPDEYWTRKAPMHSTPGARYDHYRFNGNVLERSRVINDHVGRQHYRVDFNNHARIDHSKPHLHEYSWLEGRGPEVPIRNRYDWWR